MDKHTIFIRLLYSKEQISCYYRKIAVSFNHSMTAFLVRSRIVMLIS